MRAWYNEIDPGAAAWLRELIAGGHLPPGDVDERDIRDIRPSDLRGYDQCHFFAGIGGWSLALRLAGWPDDPPVWTGSCPCQPFSAAGKGLGATDERHLWPHWHHLIRECRPPIVFGEQVASKGGLGWLDLVCADLEGEDYAVGAADLCAAGAGAPHIRQRLWFVGHDLRSAASGLAYCDDAGLEGRREPGRERAVERLAGSGGVVGGLADGDGGNPGAKRQQRSGQHGLVKKDSRASLGLADGTSIGREVALFHDRGRRSPLEQRKANVAGSDVSPDRTRPTDGFWRDADWLFCRDGKWRPVEPGSQPLVTGLPGRVGLLRGYGNAIVPQVAAAFVESYLSARPDCRI